MMADPDSLSTGSDPGRTNKYHEGWTYHKSHNSKEWTKYWIVLRGQVLFIFKSQRTNDPGTHVGTLNLQGDTDVKSLPSEGRKKGYKFDMTTTSNKGDRKVNKFKFDKENDRDLWKSYILGIAKGIIPTDVHLLPGQLRDVVEAISDFRNRPPPLPTMTRHRSPPASVVDSRIPRSTGSDSSGSFRSHLTNMNTGRKDTTYNQGGDGTVNNLRQLYRRQDSLVNSTLNNKDERTDPIFHEIHDVEVDTSSEMQWGEFSFGAPPPSSRSRNQQSSNRPTYDDSPPQRQFIDPPQRPMFYDDDPAPPQADPSNPLGHLFPGSKPSSEFGGIPTVPRKRPETAHYDVSPNVQRPASPVMPAPGRRPASPVMPAPGRRPASPLMQAPGRRPASPVMQAPGRRPPSPEEDYDSRTFQYPSADDTARVTVPDYTLGSSRQEYSSHQDSTYAQRMARKQAIYDPPEFGNYYDIPHQFYRDPSKNGGPPPSWFFEGCSREEAESILTMGKSYGNVMLRESVTFRNTGSYVISLRREVAGGTQLNHYEVKRTSNGFKINVDNVHSPMKSLEEVINFFIMQAGGSTRPMTTNDYYKLGLPTLARKSDRNNNRSRQPIAPAAGPAPAAPSWNNTPSPPTSPPPSWNRQASWNNQSPPSSPMPPPPPPLASPPPMASSNWNGSGTKQRLQVSGNVPDFMKDVAHEVEYDIRKKGPSSTGDFSLNATVPAQSYPSETVQRNGGIDGLENRFGDLYMRADNDHQEDSFPPSPPPPPPVAPPLPGGHPTMGAPRAPPAPPAFGNFNTARPAPGRKNSWGASSIGSAGSGGYDGASTLGGPWGGRGGQSNGSFPPAPPSQSYSMQSAPSNDKPAPRGFGAGLNFEDELKGKLVDRREQIYADGATILKSNWN